MAISNAVSVTALRTLPVFQGIAPERLESVAHCAIMRRVSRGTAVVLAGDETDFVYFILNGSLKVVVSDEDGREVILTILSQGDIFGEMSVVDAEPRSATVTALAPSDLVMISQADFRRILQENFDISLRIMGQSCSSPARS